MGGCTFIIPYLNWILILGRLTRPRHPTKPRMTFLFVLASPWTIFASPQNDRHQLILVLDVHGVEVKAQTHLAIQGRLVPQVSYLHEYSSFFGLPYWLFVLSIYFIFMCKHSLSSLALLMTIHVPLMTRHDLDDIPLLDKGSGTHNVCVHLTGVCRIEILY